MRKLQENGQIQQVWPLIPPSVVVGVYSHVLIAFAGDIEQACSIRAASAGGASSQQLAILRINLNRRGRMSDLSKAHHAISIAGSNLDDLSTGEYGGDGGMHNLRRADRIVIDWMRHQIRARNGHDECGGE